MQGNIYGTIQQFSDLINGVVKSFAQSDIIKKSGIEITIDKYKNTINIYISKGTECNRIEIIYNHEQNTTIN